MKKKFLVTMALSGIASTSSIAAANTSGTNSDQRVELNQVLPDNSELEVIYIGNRNKPTREQIKAALRNKNGLNKLQINEILSEIEIPEADITTTSAIIKAKVDSEVYQGQITVNFTVVQPVPLSKQVLNLDLGIIKTEGQDISEEIIKEQLKQQYPTLKIDKIHLVEITEKSAKILSDGTTYSGFINITYSFDKIIDLTKQLMQPHLGTFVTHGNYQRLEELKKWIITTIKAKNQKINEAKIHISDITKRNALVTGSSDTYKGKVTVTFTINEAVALTEILPNGTYLGTIKTNGKTITRKEKTIWIINQLKEQYPNLELSKVNVWDVFFTSAKVTAIDENWYRGEAMVFYAIDQSVPLSQVLPDDTDIGTIYIGNANKPTKAQIETALHHKIPDLVLSAITISNISDHNATITGIDDTYIGVTIINFKVTNFIEITGITDVVTNLVTANDGTLYAAIQKSDGAAAVFVKEKQERTFKKELTDITGEITSLTVDRHKNVYVSTKVAWNRGKVYKCDVKGTKFAEMSFLREFIIRSLTIDNDGHIYVVADEHGSNSWVFRRYAWQKDFSQIRSDGTYGKLNLIFVDKDGNVYARNDQNQFFKYDSKADKFVSINKNDIQEPNQLFDESFKEGEDLLTYFASDQVGNRYGASSMAVYQMVKGTNNWILMAGISSEIKSLTNDPDGLIYVGTKDGKVYQYHS